jgi:phospholipid transport system substrate-binding protein
MLRIILVFFFCCTVAASPMAADESLETFVETTSQNIVAQINEGRAGFDEDPGVLYGQMGAALDPLVDFETLTKGIMGKYYKGATDDHKTEFQRTLRIFIIEAYTKALVNFRSKTIEVIPLKKAPTTKATVSMNVTTQDNKKFKLTYSMAKKESRWLVRNIIVDGINMGLTYRSQFDSMMISNGNNIDAVIDNWGSASDDEKIEK